MWNVRPAVTAVAVIVTMLFVYSAGAQQEKNTGKRKRALLIGVSNYERPVGKEAHQSWWNLNSHNDVEQIRRVITGKRFGFDDVRILTDFDDSGAPVKGKTTAASILAALNKLASDTAAGDVVYIHYSGHGMPVPDDDGDEPDGFDESLVPSDYKSKRDGSGNLRDDEIGKALDAIAARKPESLTVTIDSCFSGNATRGGQHVARGDDYPGEAAPGRPTGAEASGLLRPGLKALEVVTVLSAGRSDQVVWEDGARKIGIFTAAWIQELEGAEPGTSYRQIYNGVAGRVAAETRNIQEPQIEGWQDRQLFTGVDIQPAPKSYEIEATARGITMKAGQVHGVTDGTIVALYAAGTEDPEAAEPVARAKVMKASFGSSTLALEPGADGGTLSPSKLKDCMAFIESINYAEHRILVDLAPLQTTAPGRALAEKLDAIAIVDPAATARGKTEAAAYDIRTCFAGSCPDDAMPPEKTARGSLLLQRYDGSFLGVIPPEAGDAAAAAKELIEREARSRLIIRLRNDLPASKVGVDLRIVRAAVEGDEIVRGEELVPLNGGYRLRPGDIIAFDVRNRGVRNAWVTLIDIYEDENGPWARPVWPQPRMGRDENIIRADGKWHPVPGVVIEITPVRGNEIFKAVATAEWMDLVTALDPAVTTRGPEKGSRGGIAGHPLAQLLTSATSGTRGNPVRVESKDLQWATKEIVVAVESVR